MYFINAFNTLTDYTFIMRLEGEFPKTNLKNVIFSKWLPQKDLIGIEMKLLLIVLISADPHVRLLITHGGYNSLTEATYLGVPLIIMPLFGDQHANVQRVERAGIGKRLNKAELNEQVVLQTIQ